jgi:hypothetical protein
MNSLPNGWWWLVALALTVIYVIKEVVKARRARHVGDMENVIPISEGSNDARSRSQAG